MAQRAPGDDRCKDCPEPHEPGASRCAACAKRHRLAAAERSAKLRKSKRCAVCSQPVAKRQAAGGKEVLARYCAQHLAYYAARSAEA